MGQILFLVVISDSSSSQRICLKVSQEEIQFFGSAFSSELNCWVGSAFQFCVCECVYHIHNIYEAFSEKYLFSLGIKSLEEQILWLEF